MKTAQTKASIRRITGILLLLASGIYIGRYIIPSNSAIKMPASLFTIENGERRLAFPTFWEAWDELHENYIGELDDRDLLYGSVAGMVRSAGDPYTVFTEPAKSKQFEDTLSGSFSGVGIEIGVKNGLVTVIAPLDGSPAKQAGIRAEDIIVAVDEEQITQDMTIDDVVQLIRGKKQTEVILTVVHKNETSTEDIAIIRDTINIESVKISIEDDIAHIKLTNFNSDTAAQFEDAIKKVKKQNTKGIILDLRGNPGGFLQSAVDIASYFLEPGTLIVSEKGKTNQPHKAAGGALLRGMPVVALVNQGSASASEILAGALQDQLDTPIIGMQTFGKGSVQEMVKLSDGSSLRVTVAKWYTPNDRSINDEGIAPTVEIEDDEETEEDEQLIKAKEEIKKLY